jgi:hypothetical protein
MMLPGTAGFVIRIRMMRRNIPFVLSSNAPDLEVDVLAPGNFSIGFKIITITYHLSIGFEFTVLLNYNFIGKWP